MLWGLFSFAEHNFKPLSKPPTRAKMLVSINAPGTLKALIDPKQQK